jgi:glutathione S-transferase
LAVSKISYGLREVHLARKPSAMLAASPKGTIPVLVLEDGRVIDESLAIMRWALTQHDPDGWLERDDAELIADNDGAFKSDLDRYKYSARHDSDPVIHRTRAMEFVRELDARLVRGGQLCGAEPGLADVAVMPFVRQFAAVDADWFANQRLHGVHAWLAGHLSSPLFLSVMVRQGCSDPLHSG